MPAGTQVGNVFFKISSDKGAFTKEMSQAAKGAEGAFSSSMGKIKSSVTAAFSVKAVLSFGKKSVETAAATQSAWLGLNSIIEGQGRSYKKANDFIEGYISDGLVPLNNAITAYKNLLARGYDQEQVMATMNALKDSAAFGRQASLSYGEAIQSATEGLKNENSILVDNAGVTKNVSKMWEEYAKQTGTSVKNLTQQQKIQAEVNGILRETRWQTGDAAKAADTFAGKTAKLSATLTRLKTAFGNVIIPVVNLFISYIQIALEYTASFFEALQRVMKAIGMEIPDMTPMNSGFSNVALNASDAASAIEETGPAAEKAAKRAKGAFASFDEINVLPHPEATSGASSSGGSAGGGNPYGDAFSAYSPVSPQPYDTSTIESSLSQITALVSTALLAFGVVLTFTGANVPLGIALMAAGAAGLASAMAIDWNSTADDVSGVVDIISVLLSGALIVVGAVLAFSGNLPLGIGLMVAGAAGLASAVAMNWNNIPDEMKTIVSIITGIVGGALLALGAVLAFSQANIPLGIALMAIGAVAIVSSIAMNWNGVSDKISTIVSIIAGVVGGALLAIGAVLAFSGINTPLGIALMAAGAVSLIAAIAPNWKGLSDKTKNTIAIISGVAGGALLAIGAVLAFSGINTPLGIALMAAGGAALATAIAPNWDYITEKVSGIWEKIKSKFSDVKTFFSDKFTGAKTAIENAFKGIPSFFSNMWERIKAKFTSIGSKIGGAISGAFKTAINATMRTIENVVNAPIRAINKLSGVINKIPGINLGYLDTFTLPRLAEGGWVAANNPRLAIVGDNTREGEIITPESKIREQVEMALDKAQQGISRVKLQLEILIKYPDGRTIIKTINEAQLEEGRILLEV